MKQQMKNLGFGFFVLLLYNIFIPFIYSLIFMDFLTSENTIIANLSLLGLYILILATLLLIFRKSLIKEAKQFWEKKKEYFFKALKYWLIGIGIMMILNAIIVTIQGNIAANEEANRKMMSAAPFISTIIIVICAPVIEELAFRKSFKKAFHHKLTFALFTGLLFGSAHVIPTIDFHAFATTWTGLLFILPYGGLGIVFGLLYYETDNIFTTILTHIIHNSFSAALIFLMM